MNDNDTDNIYVYYDKVSVFNLTNIVPSAFVNADAFLSFVIELKFFYLQRCSCARRGARYTYTSRRYY